jgi:GT2 family glycosyltransferase/glycosyltransferase involved in cell wall biosynthesis
LPPLIVCTLITKNRLAYARVLARSVAEHQPGTRLTVLVVDPIDGAFEPAAEPFDVLSLEELAVPGVWELAVRYDAFELTMALKPWLLRRMLERDERVVYLDADMELLGSLDPLERALDEHPVVLTPHLLAPIPDDGEVPSEPSILVAGAHNAGCVGMRRSEAASALLEWWAARLRTGSRVRPADGLMVDQHWLDLAPALFEAVGLLRDPGINVAYWNLPARPLSRAQDGSLTVGGAPLRLLHLSGFDHEEPRRLSRYDTRFADLDPDEPLGALTAAYAAALEREGISTSLAWPYGYDRTASGIALDRPMREVLDPGPGAGPEASPFHPDGERAWLAWWNAPAPTGGEHGVSRYLARLHASRVDLRDGFPDLAGEDGARYRHWAFAHGRTEVPIPAALLPLALDGATPRAPGQRGPGLRLLEPGERLEVARGETVVCVPVYGARDLFVRCVRALLRHTAPDVPILVLDDASPDPGPRRFLYELRDAGGLDHHVAYLRRPENAGFVATVNLAFDVAGEADVVVLNSDCLVGPGWLGDMRSAAYSDSNVATASALTNHGTILSVPHRNRPVRDLPQDADFETVARRVHSRSLGLAPRIPTAVGHCMLIRRDAIDLVGGFDLAFSPGYGEEVDFSQRCTLQGLSHVAADGALVLHRQGGTFGEDGLPSPIQAAHEAIINQRYPYYDRTQTAFQTSDVGALPRALRVARAAVRGVPTVTVDGRVLGPFLTGTQVHAVELIGALHRTGALGLRVIVPPDLGDYARTAFAGMPGLQLLAAADVGPGLERTEVVHRPFQVSSLADLELLRTTGERHVVTHQDLIAYRNPGYFPAYPQWEEHRRLTRLAMAIADRVVFFSEHAARDALAESLLDESRADVVHIGVDHRLLDQGPEPVAPEGAEGLDDEPFLLCLGTDFRHKNRLFALRLLEALQTRHGWTGRLVLAGPRVAEGSSLGDEDAFLATRPEVEAKVVRLPAVSESGKAWLYAHANASLYPTIYEGFGLMPFEAADHDRACLFAWTSSLQEVLPRSAATLVPWDPDASADRVIGALRDPVERARLVDAVRTAARRFRWDGTARALLDVYRSAAEAPTREASVMAWDQVALAREREDFKLKYEDLWLALSDDARSFLGPASPLSAEHQRSLRALVNRPALRAPLLGALRAGYRAGRTVRRTDDAPPIPEDNAARAEAFLAHFGHANRNHMAEQLRRTDPKVGEPGIE